MGFDVTNYQFDNWKNNTYGKTENEILSNHRVISLFTSPVKASRIINDSYRWCNTANCTWSDYRFIHMNFQIGTIVNNKRIEPWRCDQTYLAKLHSGECECCDDDENIEYTFEKKIYSNVIQIVSDFPNETAEQKAFHCKFLNSSGVTDCIEKATLIQLIYDTVWVYAHALNETNTTDATSIISTLKSINITGRTGVIWGNNVGSRYSSVVAYFLKDPSDRSMTASFRIKPRNHNSTTFDVEDLGFEIPPITSDVPPCKWYDLQCGVLLYYLVAGCIVVLIATLICFGYKIRVIRTYPDRSFMLSPEKLEKLRESERTKKVRSYYEHVMDFKINVFGHKIMFSDQKILDLLNELHVIHHPNIQKLHHCSVQPNQLLFFTDYCSKGSLHQLIQSEKKICDQIFLRSFALDIIKGLMYLHDSKFAYHGYLNSMNCLVDAR